MEYEPVRKLSGDSVSDPNTVRELEACNLPAVLINAVENWPAITHWDPANGGLHHLKACWRPPSIVLQRLQAGSHEVEVAISFGEFMDRITSGVTGDGSRPPVATDGNEAVIPVSGMPIDKVETTAENRRGEVEHGLKLRAPDGQLYLAQVPIFSREPMQETTLSPLMQDIQMPQLLETQRISDINLWMSMTDSRSSTHYDPYHNLLCVVAGEKKGDTALDQNPLNMKLKNFGGHSQWVVKSSSSDQLINFTKKKGHCKILLSDSRVTLWPPSAAPFLYPLPINGEASNHSGVDFLQPDYKAHPLFHKALSLAQPVILHPGDALFIPEGWYHQVDNFGVTIAVNFWWPSRISLAVGTHMDAYFLRRILVNLVDEEKDRMLGNDLFRHRKQRQLLPGADACNSISGPVLAPKDDRGEIFLHAVDESHETNSNKGNNDLSTDIMATAQSGTSKSPKQYMKLEDLSPLETYNLNCLVESLATNSAGTPTVVSKASQSASRLEDCKGISSHCNSSDSSELHQDNSKEIPCKGISGHPQNDSLTRVFSTSTALSLQHIFLVMAKHFPRMLETLMLKSLSPAAAEILTRKFEELDASTEESSQAAFYEQFYSAFESPDAVMEALLNGKEAFSAQALRNVLSQYLSIDVTGSSFYT